MNSMDIFNNVVLKLDFPYFNSYIFLSCFSITLIFLLNLNRIQKKIRNVFLYTLIIIFSYFIIQFLNGLFHTDNYKSSLVVFLSFIFSITLIVTLRSTDGLSIRYYLKGLYYLTLAIYPVVDFLSIIFLDKSQHVLIENVLPILAIGSFVLIITAASNIEKLFLIISFLIYITWGVLSVFYFTDDQRFQIKAYLFLMAIFVFYFFFILLNKIAVIRNIMENKIFVCFSCILTIVFGLIVLIPVYLNIMEYDLVDRGSSYYLRNLVGSFMLKDWAGGGILNILFGKGLGASFLEYCTEYNEKQVCLKSHSGLISLLYEHGVFLGIIFIGSIFFWFRVFVLNPSKLKPIVKRRDSSILISIFLILAFIVFYNFTYIFSVPVPNYGEQTQMIFCIILLMYCRSLFGGKWEK